MKPTVHREMLDVMYLQVFISWKMLPEKDNNYTWLSVKFNYSDLLIKTKIILLDHWMIAHAPSFIQEHEHMYCISLKIAPRYGSKNIMFFSWCDNKEWYTKQVTIKFLIAY